MNLLFGSVNLGKWLGTEVKLHNTFIIYFLLRLLTENPISVLIFFIIVFGSVLLHEYGHVFAARYYGISTNNIILTPIGGMASISEIPKHPWKEFVITIAGPSINFIICLFAIIANRIIFTLSGMTAEQMKEPSFLLSITTITIFFNAIMMIFNLIPAFPMDGGRILRSILHTRMNHTKATEIAVSVSKFFLIIFISIGIVYSRPDLILIAAFMWLAGNAELTLARK